MITLLLFRLAARCTFLFIIIANFQCCYFFVYAAHSLRQPMIPIFFPFSYISLAYSTWLGSWLSIQPKSGAKTISAELSPPAQPNFLPLTLDQKQTAVHRLPQRQARLSIPSTSSISVVCGTTASGSSATLSAAWLLRSMCLCGDSPCLSCLGVTQWLTGRDWW